jgi:hypothetical protein
MKPEHRARILEPEPKAKQLELCLQDKKGRSKAIGNALMLKGSMSESEASGLSARTRMVRAKWR